MDRDQRREPGLRAARRPIAPLNPDPRWPQGYFQVLEELGVPERRRGFYAHWVRQFFNRCQGTRRRRDLGRQDIERFLADLGRQTGAAEWQVAQVREALQVHYEQFRGIALAPRPAASAVHARPLVPAKPAAPTPPAQKRSAAAGPRSPMVHESGQRYPASARGVKTNGATHPHVVETGDQCTAIHRDRQAGNEVPPGYRFADYERYWEVRFDIQTESHGAPTLDVDSRGVPSLGVFE